jgi:hypothetical protein
VGLEYHEVRLKGIGDSGVAVLHLSPRLILHNEMPSNLLWSWPL